MSINGIRELIEFPDNYSDAEVVVSAYFRGLLTKKEVAEYMLKLYGNSDRVPNWIRPICQFD